MKYHKLTKGQLNARKKRRTRSKRDRVKIKLFIKEVLSNGSNTTVSPC